MSRPRLLGMLFAALVVAAILAVWRWQLSSGEGHADTVVDVMNEKRTLDGLPTLPASYDPNATVILPPLPTSTPGPSPTPAPCGPRNGGSGTIIAEFGQARSCVFYDGFNVWVLTTLGNATVSGVLAIFSCAPNDVTCIKGGEVASGKWEIFEPPVAGGLAIMGFKPPDHIRLSQGLCFTLGTRQFSVGPACGG